MDYKEFEELPVIPIEQFQKNFDEYLEDIETNKTSYVIENENGDKAVMMPADDEFMRLYTEHEEGC